MRIMSRQYYLQTTLYKGADAEKLKSRRNLRKKGLEYEELNENERCSCRRNVIGVWWKNRH